MSNFSKGFLFAVLCFMPTIALAHSPIEGIGDFFNGMLHPLLVPAQILAILALGLFLGQHSINKHKTTVLLFLGATIAGLVATLFEFDAAAQLSMLSLISAVVIGLLIVIGVKIHWSLFLVLGITVGFIVGMDSSAELPSRKAQIVSLFGSGVGIYFLLLYAMAISESFSVKHWQTIAVRVVASWVSASALMVLALSFSNKF